MGHQTFTAWECDLCGEEARTNSNGAPPLWQGFAWFDTPQHAEHRARFVVCPPCGIGLRYLLGSTGLVEREKSASYTAPNRSALQGGFLQALDPEAYADDAINVAEKVDPVGRVVPQLNNRDVEVAHGSDCVVIQQRHPDGFIAGFSADNARRLAAALIAQADAAGIPEATDQEPPRGA